MANTRRGYNLPRAVRFSVGADGNYVILDHGGRANEPCRIYNEAGTIKPYAKGDGRRWAVFDMAGNLLSSGHENLNQAKCWYLTRRGIPTAPPDHSVQVGIIPIEWERAEDWRARVWAALLRRNRAPAIDKLLTPVANSSGFLVFKWPEELAADWDRYRLTTL